MLPVHIVLEFLLLGLPPHVLQTPVLLWLILFQIVQLLPREQAAIVSPRPRVLRFIQFFLGKLTTAFFKEGALGLRHGHFGLLLARFLAFSHLHEGLLADLSF